MKSRGGNQIENLTPNHKSFENRGQMRSDWSMLYIVGKIVSRDIRCCGRTLKKDFIREKYELLKFWNNKNPNFGTRIWEFRGKVTFGCSPRGEAHSII